MRAIKAWGAPGVSLGDFSRFSAGLWRLRQHTGYHDGDKGILIVEDFASSAISFEQLQKMFLPYRVFMIQALKDEINRAFLGKATDTGFEKP
jgi:hypothetical protein